MTYSADDIDPRFIIHGMASVIRQASVQPAAPNVEAYFALHRAGFNGREIKLYAAAALRELQVPMHPETPS